MIEFQCLKYANNILKIMDGVMKFHIKKSFMILSIVFNNLLSQEGFHLR